MEKQLSCYTLASFCQRTQRMGLIDRTHWVFLTYFSFLDRPESAPKSQFTTFRNKLFFWEKIFGFQPEVEQVTNLFESKGISSSIFSTYFSTWFTEEAMIFVLTQSVAEKTIESGISKIYTRADFVQSNHSIYWLSSKEFKVESVINSDGLTRWQTIWSNWHRIEFVDYSAILIHTYSMWFVFIFIPSNRYRQFYQLFILRWMHASHSGAIKSET